MLILGAVGAGLVLLRRRATPFLGIGAVILVSFVFYFFVDVRDHQYVYVGWRAGHFLFIAFAVLVAYGLQELWRLAGRARAATLASTAVLALLALPTFAIDFYNTQDITNQNPADSVQLDARADARRGRCARLDPRLDTTRCRRAVRAPCA